MLRVAYSLYSFKGKIRKFVNIRKMLTLRNKDDILLNGEN